MVYYCKAPITLYQISDYTPNLLHLDFIIIPHLGRMFKRNLFTKIPGILVEKFEQG